MSARRPARRPVRAAVSWSALSESERRARPPREEATAAADLPAGRPHRACHTPAPVEKWKSRNANHKTTELAECVGPGRAEADAGPPKAVSVFVLWLSGIGGDWNGQRRRRRLGGGGGSAEGVHQMRGLYVRETCSPTALVSLHSCSASGRRGDSSPAPAAAGSAPGPPPPPPPPPPASACRSCAPFSLSFLLEERRTSRRSLSLLDERRTSRLSRSTLLAPPPPPDGHTGRHAHTSVICCFRAGRREVILGIQSHTATHQTDTDITASCSVGRLVTTYYTFLPSN